MSNFEEYTLVVRETNKEFYSEVPENRFIASLKEISESSLYDYGKTQEEAISNLREQFGYMVKEFQFRSIELPSPQKSGERKFSGRLVVRMPKWLHRRITEFASEEELSINSYIVNRLTNNISTEELYKSFCSNQQKLFDKLRYTFSMRSVRMERKPKSTPIFNISNYSAEKSQKEYGNVGT